MRSPASVRCPTARLSLTGVALFSLAASALLAGCSATMTENSSPKGQDSGYSYTPYGYNYGEDSQTPQQQDSSHPYAHE